MTRTFGRRSSSCLPSGAWAKEGATTTSSRSARGRARILLNRDRRGLDEVRAEPGDVLDLHLAFLQPDPVAHLERLALVQVLHEVGPEAPVVALAEARLLGV